MSENYRDTLKNKTLTVVTIKVTYAHLMSINKVSSKNLQGEPYCFEKPNPNGELKGNDRFEGFCIDLIEEIANDIGFKYVVKLVDDGKHGSLNEVTREWDGMIKELIEGVSTVTILISI